MRDKNNGFTPQQEDAIQRKGKFTILSAAAGSGKTTVLVERIIRLITDNNADISKMLIVTFTRASRADFTRKINIALDKKIAEYETAEKSAKRAGNSAAAVTEKKNRLLKQKSLVKNADIQTINSFALKLSLENFESLGIPSDSVVCDEPQAADMHEKAIDKAMDYGYTLTDFNNLVACFGKSSSDREIREFLKKMHNFFHKQSAPEKSAQAMCDMYARTDVVKDSPFYSVMAKSIQRQCDYILFLSQRIDTVFARIGTTGYEKGIAGMLETASLAKHYADNEDFDSLKKHLESIEFSIGRASNKKATEYDKEVASAVKDIYDKDIKSTINNILKDLSYLDDKKFASDNAATKAYIRVLFDVYNKYQSVLFAEKMRRKSFEFNDFEHFAVKLLMNDDGTPTALCKNLREHYDYIMEDEYQDTSAVQDAIFCLLSKENLSDFYVVGDIKQSIYRFRNATPQIFIDKRKLGNENPDMYNTMYLSKNFRSDYGILRDINYIFSQLMNENCGGIVYDDNEKLYYRDDTYTPSDKDVTTRLALLENDEAHYVASEIGRMIQEKVMIGKDKDRRCVNAGDICILLRSKTRMAEFRDALSEISIDSVVKDDNNVFDRPEILSVLNVLRIIANPMQEIYLTGAMFGDLADFSLDDLIDLRKENKRANLYKLLKSSDSEKAKKFLSQLQELQMNADMYSPDKLIDHICQKTGYYRKIAFSDNGGEKRENIRWFISFAKDWAKTHTQDLSAFLRWTDIHIENAKKESVTVTPDIGKVNIMTIHSSKGLEFPVVFICDLGRRFYTDDISDSNMLLHSDLGVGLFRRKQFGRNVSTLQIAALKKAMYQDVVDDEIRLLYVAMTRAKNLLYLTAQKHNIDSYKKRLFAICGDGIPEYITRVKQSYLEWILCATAKTAVSENSLIYGSADGSNLCDIRYAEGDVSVTETFAEDKPDEFVWRDETINTAMENMNFAYPHELKTRLPIKVSVSLIAKPHEITVQKPDFARNGNYSRAEKGTAMHSFTQHCDILAARADISKETDRLSAKGLINRDLLDTKAILTFVNSPVADMILSAENVERERNFRIPISAAIAMNDTAYRGEEVLLQGVMDCVITNGDEVTVIDYKTDKVRNMDILKERYSAQLNLYRMGAKALYGTENVKCVLYSFALGEYIYV